MNIHDFNTASAERSAQETRCTWLGLGTDVVMSVIKIAFGLWGRSTALLADGAHSIGDCCTDAIALAMMRVSGKGIDENYRYGRGKFETLTAFLISIIMLLVGLELLTEGGSEVWAAIHGAQLDRPELLTLVVAVMAVVVKEGLFQYTHHVGRRLDSKALLAYAWHHRGDALSSLATLGGIAGAIFLGERWRVLDPLAAIIVSGLIITLAYRLGKPAVKELLEVSLPADKVEQIGQTIARVDGVKAFHNLRTRRNGTVSVVDVHIKVDGDLSVTQSHAITTQIEQCLQALLGQAITSIHVEPFRGQNLCEKNHHGEN